MVARLSARFSCHRHFLRNRSPYGRHVVAHQDGRVTDPTSMFASARRQPLRASAHRSPAAARAPCPLGSARPTVRHSEGDEHVQRSTRQQGSQEAEEGDAGGEVARHWHRRARPSKWVQTSAAEEVISTTRQFGTALLRQLGP
jgi:hypothetical protein